MSSDAEEPQGPDLTKGVPAADVPEGGMLAGLVGEDAVVVARVDGALFAIGGHCTHYHGPLGDGLWSATRCAVRGTTRAFACAPARRSGRRRSIRSDAGRSRSATGPIVVRAAAAPPAAKPKRSGGPKRVLIAGGGAAGFAAAEMLRREGFDGEVTLLSNDATAPYDRPNCSKDYLAGEAPAEWMPLRGDDWYADNGIALRLKTEIGALDLGARTASLASGESLSFDALVIATGAEPLRPPIPGFDAANVFTLRSLADADAIIRAAEGARRVAVVGASFIGLEAAAALRHRGLEVHVAAPEAIPLARILGDDIGRWVRRLHEDAGVVFHLGRKVQGFANGALALDEGAIEADFVVAGMGVRPRVALAEAAGLKIDNGIVVDARLMTSAAGVYAAGDVARYPDPHTGKAIRVEHWVHAERQGQHVARAILGDDGALCRHALLLERAPGPDDQLRRPCRSVRCALRRGLARRRRRGRAAGQGRAADGARHRRPRPGLPEGRPGLRARLAVRPYGKAWPYELFTP